MQKRGSVWGRQRDREVIKNIWDRESSGLPEHRLPVGKGMTSVIACRCKALSDRFKEYCLLSYRK